MKKFGSGHSHNRKSRGQQDKPHDEKIKRAKEKNRAFQEWRKAQKKSDEGYDSDLEVTPPPEPVSTNIPLAEIKAPPVHKIPEWLQRGIAAEKARYYGIPPRQNIKPPVPESHAPIEKPAEAESPPIKPQKPRRSPSSSAKDFTRDPGQLFDEHIPEKCRAGLLFDAWCKRLKVTSEAVASWLNISADEVNEWRASSKPIPETHVPAISDRFSQMEKSFPKMNFLVTCNTSRAAFDNTKGPARA